MSFDVVNSSTTRGRGWFCEISLEIVKHNIYRDFLCRSVSYSYLHRRFYTRTTMEDGSHEIERVKKSKKSKKHSRDRKRRDAYDKHHGEKSESRDIEKKNDVETVNSATKTPERKTDSPESPCSICLGKLENKSFTDSCFHTFCFVCLLEWSKVKAVCPLCKQPFKSIIHNVRSIEDYDQYDISQSNQPGSSDPRSRGSFRYRSTQYSQWEDEQAVEQRRQMDLLQRPTRSTASFNWRRYRQSATSAFRKRVYARGMRVKELRSTRGQAVRCRQVTPEFFRENPACAHRLVPWLNRELNVLLVNQAENVHFVLDLILDLIKRFHIQSEEFHQHLQSLIGRRTEHFIHEFYHFSRAPYDMLGYDRHAVYDEHDGHSADIHTIDNDSEPTPSPGGNDDDDDVVMMSSPIPGLAALPSSSAAPDHSYSTSLSLWPSQPSTGFSLTLSPLFYRVQNFLASVSTTEAGLGGWESPDNAASSSMWASSMSTLYSDNSLQWPVPGTSSQITLSADDSISHNSRNGQHPHHKRIRSRSASSHDSDIIVVAAEKPWGERSPIRISSDSDDEEIEVIEDFTKDKKKSTHSTRSPSTSYSSRHRHSHSHRYRHRSGSRDRHRVHEEKEWRHKKYDYVSEHHGSRNSSHHRSRSYGSGRQHSDYSASGYRLHARHASPLSASESRTSKHSNSSRVHEQYSEQSGNHHKKSSRHSQHKKHKKHKHKKHKKSKRSHDSSEDDIVHLSSKITSYVSTKKRTGEVGDLDGEVHAAASASDSQCSSNQVYKKHSSGHKRSKFADPESLGKSSANEDFCEGPSGSNS